MAVTVGARHAGAFRGVTRVRPGWYRIRGTAPARTLVVMTKAPDVGHRPDDGSRTPVTPPSPSDDLYGDPNILIDAHEDRWAWRARIKSKPTTRRLYRGVVGVVGVTIVLLGVVALPAPGPGWAIIFVGLAVLASEFEKAQQLLDFAKKHVRRWTVWVTRQHVFVRMLVGLAVLALVLAIFWAYFAVVGVPGWLPDMAEKPLLQFVPGLG
jgi:uncharacterized protein (TIGR02611 family)